MTMDDVCDVLSGRAYWNACGDLIPLCYCEACELGLHGACADGGWDAEGFAVTCDCEGWCGGPDDVDDLVAEVVALYEGAAESAPSWPAGAWHGRDDHDGDACAPLAVSR